MTNFLSLFMDSLTLAHRAKLPSLRQSKRVSCFPYCKYCMKLQKVWGRVEASLIVKAYQVVVYEKKCDLHLKASR